MILDMILYGLLGLALAIADVDILEKPAPYLLILLVVVLIDIF